MKVRLRLSLLMLLILAVFASCGAEREVYTVGETNSNITNGAFYNSVIGGNTGKGYATQGEAQAATEGDADALISEYPAAYGVFKTGTWVATRPYVSCCYFVFNDDKLTGRRIEAGDGRSTDFDFSEGTLPEELRFVSCDQTDEDYITAEYADKTKMVFRYVSDKTDDFKFYTEKELCNLARDYYLSGRDIVAPEAVVEEWDHETVTIYLGNWQGDTVNIWAIYVMDRLTAHGKNRTNNTEFDPVSGEE